MARKTTPHDDEDGFVTARSNANVDGYVVLYDGREAGFDTDNGRWSMFCSAHGSIQNETSRQRATKMLAAPESWCRMCARAIEERTQTRTLQVRSIKRMPDDKDHELRFWAKKAKNSPEKQALFEQMFGVRPDAYW